MTPRRSLALLLALVLAAGCSTSREATQPTPPTTADTQAPADTTDTQAPADPQASGEPAAPGSQPGDDAEEEPKKDALAPDQAATDWQHTDADGGSYPGVATGRAYAWLGERAPQDTVVVAVLDSGVDPTHEDLDDVLWTNADEVPGNDRDDDQNGYVDDVHGWNFVVGPGGESIEHDTFEVTRLYNKLRGTYGSVNPDTLTAAEREEYERFQKIKADFQKQKQRYEQQYSQLQRVAGIVGQARPMLESALGTEEPLTLKRLHNLPAGTGQRAKQAAQLFSTLLERTGEPDVAAVAESLSKAVEQLRTRVEYNFDPTYEPRPTFGADSAGASGRPYGNADVAGPDPGHGTGVASLIAAERDNDRGIRGVANAVKIMPVRTVPGGDERDRDVARAIRYAAENGADIINMSFGKAYSPRKEVVDAAVQHADSAGVLLVHAAGNDGADVDTTDTYPSAFYADGGDATANWISVGASTAKSDSTLAASFSNYGDERVDLFAPGASMYVARPKGAYGRAQGTSFAAPVVSGVAALVMAYYPSLSAEQVKEVLLSSATDYAGQMVQRPGGGPGGSSNAMGSNAMVRFGDLSRTGGVVNAYAALRAAERMAE